MAQKFAANPDAVRNFVIYAVGEGLPKLAEQISQEFGVSTPTAYNYIRTLLDEDVITRVSHGRYELTKFEEMFTHDVAGLEEHVVWSDEIAPTLGGLPSNVSDILHYSSTEMINNVVDHSSSVDMTIVVEATAAETTVHVIDSGVGIFRKIATELGLKDDRHAVLELSKGKMTTDPESHTGEGIFFSSRACDKFKIFSRGVFFSHEMDKEEDWILERPPENVEGTTVTMTMRTMSQTRLSDVFDKYATDTEDYRFDKTVVPVKLMQYGDDQLVSRSQAKRLMSRFDRFRTVVLDFTDVPSIGQAFADEVFRVFRSKHPQVEVVPIYTNEKVARMITRVQNGG